MNTFADYQNKTKLGEYYGYPKCCIDNFMENIRNCKPVNKLNFMDNYKAANNTGFIPCDEHTRKILQKEVKLKDIIINRQCENKFPIGGGLALEPFKQKLRELIINKTNIKITKV